MNPAIDGMLAQYSCKTATDYTNALKEIIQEVALLGLARGKFFEHAAFYGGTALRILHGLDRFSEDLDFTLLGPRKDFSIENYFTELKNEFSAFNFELRVESVHKSGDSAIESAFIKGGTKIHFLKVGAPKSICGLVPENQLLKIKFEIDTDPPGKEKFERKIHPHPVPFPLTTLTLPCLFSGKMHALLFRNWGNRTKGRDWYDWVWYISKGVSVDLVYLQAKIKQSTGKNFDRMGIEALLKKKIEDFDVAQAKRDVAPFIRDSRALDFWSKEYFHSLAEKTVFL